MKTPIHILMVEDSEKDVELIMAALEHGEFDPKWKRVETERDFLAEIKNLPDIILSDYSMPQFTGLRAAELLQATGLNIPFILISGTVGEDVAVNAMKHGAMDYLLKDRITRLPNAVERALEQKHLLAERQRAAAALRESEEKFRQIAESINEVFWITVPAKNQMLYISPGYEKIWGQTCESLYESPQRWLEAIHPEDRQRILEASTSKQESGEYDEIYRIIRPDGSKRWIHDKAFPVRNQAGEVYRIVGVAEDITQSRKLEEQFRQSQKMEAIGQLAGGVAHDFNNLLAIIQMQADSLKMSGSPTPKELEVAEEIADTVGRGAALTRQLLLFSRREVFQPCELDLSASVTSMTKMLRRVLGETIDVQISLAAQPMFVYADAGMIDQALLNLVVNARDAMPAGGRLVIQTVGVEFDAAAAVQCTQARPGSFVCLSVADCGCGIAPEILPKIFEPFFTTKEVGKGTGLGLATVFGIAQQHQGWVNVSSVVGQGATFRIYIPRLAKKEEPLPSQPPQTALRGGDETILLVEDEFSLRVSVRATLSQLGYNILDASTGIEAVRIWKNHPGEIALLLTDLIMPGGMNGKELAQLLVRDDSKALKVIYMSGYSTEIAGNNLHLKDGLNFLVKPFPTYKLAQTIRHCLDTAT